MLFRLLLFARREDRCFAGLSLARQVGVVRLVREVMNAGIGYEEIDTNHETLPAMIDLLKVAIDGSFCVPEFVHG